MKYSLKNIEGNILENLYIQVFGRQVGEDCPRLPGTEILAPLQRGNVYYERIEDRALSGIQYQAQNFTSLEEASISCDQGSDKLRRDVIAITFE